MILSVNCFDHVGSPLSDCGALAVENRIEEHAELKQMEHSHHHERIGLVIEHQVDVLHGLHADLKGLIEFRALRVLVHQVKGILQLLIIKAC